MTRRGVFITFEGGEGAGKSTQISRLAERLKKSGARVLATREPGGSPGAEDIRDLLVTGDPDRWTPLSETLLLCAARADHLDRLIRPALSRGEIVICDRFADSTRAYQGAAGHIPDTAIHQLNELTVGETWPDLTFILDIDPDIGLARSGARGGAARFEGKGLDYHRAVREGFLNIARTEPYRCIVIDGAGSADDIEMQVWDAVEARLPKERS
ncbi:MAG: dTMP kinase [Pseudomonadota bacterium]